MRRRSYAIWWNEGEGARHAGKLEVGALHALLAGAGERLALPLEEIASVDYGRGELRLRRRDAPPIRIGSLDGPGALFELASRLRALGAARAAQ